MKDLNSKFKKMDGFVIYQGAIKGIRAINGDC